MKFFKKHKIFTGFLLFFLAILLLVVGAILYLWSKLGLITYDEAETPSQTAVELPEKPREDAILTEDILTEDSLAGLEMTEEAPTLPEGDIFQDSDVFNLLLIGTDERVSEFSENARSDSMMLLSIHKENKTVKLVSLERGMGVPVLSGPYEGQYDWLTHIFRYGGADLLLETVRTCFKVDVDHYVRVNLNTFRQIIEAVGGVDMELTETEALYLSSGHSTTNFTAGPNHLDGEAALAFSRLREPDSDWQRIVRQRRVLQQVLYQAKGMSLSQLNDFADQVLPLICTNLTKTDIASLLLLAPSFLGATMDQMTIPAEGTYGGMTGMGGRSLFAVDFEANAEILHEFFYE